jgi:VCBS repeat-containing protein
MVVQADQEFNNDIRGIDSIDQLLGDSIFQELDSIEHQDSETTVDLYHNSDSSTFDSATDLGSSANASQNINSSSTDPANLIASLIASGTVAFPFSALDPSQVIDVISTESPATIDLPTSDLTSNDFSLTVPSDLPSLHPTNPFENVALVAVTNLQALQAQAIYEGANLETLRTGLENVLDQLDAALKTVAFANQLPLVGSGLSTATGDAVDFLKSLRTAIATNLDTSSTDQIQQTLFNILGPAGLNWLKDTNGNGVSGELADITINDTAQQVTFDFALGRAPISVTGGIGFDIGLPGLGLKVTDGSTVRTDVDFSFNLGFGVDKDTGFFVDTAPKDELKVGLTTSLQNFNATAKLGFLQVDVTDVAAQPTQFVGTFGLDLQNGLTVVPTFNAQANVNLHLQGKIPVAGDSKTPVLPSIGTDFNLGWQFADANASNPANIAGFGNAPTLAFNNVTLNLGSFASQFVEPVLGTVQDALSPVKPVIDFLTDDLPLVGLSPIDLFEKSHTIQGQITSGEGAGKTESTKGVKVIEVLNTLLDIPADAGNIGIPLGSFNLSGGNDLRTTALTTIDVSAFQGAFQDIEQGLKDIGANELVDYLDKTKKELENQGPTFPLIQDPQQAFQLLLGKNPDLFKWDLSNTLHFGDKGEAFFGTVVGVKLSYGYDGGFNLVMGYDTKGLQEFSDSGDSEKLIDGFYLSDNVDGAGVDHPEVYLNANFDAGPAFDIPGFSVSVVGGIDGGVSLDVNDKDKDNKFRLSEIDDCFLEAAGKIEATLDAKLKVGYGIFSFTKRIPIAKGTLLSFEAGCNDAEQRDPVRNQIARNDGDELQLLMGSRAGDRVISNKKGGDGNLNEFFVVRPAINQPGQVEVAAFGAKILYNPGSQIVADGLGGGDAIAIDNAILTSANLQGNGGNDSLTGGGGSDILDGGEGDDELNGGSGNDNISGGSGDDVLTGGLGSDTLDGGDGFDIVSYANTPLTVGVKILLDANSNQLDGTSGEALGDVLKNVEYIIGTQYRDFIQGDNGKNVLEGGASNDQLFGFGDDDIIQGGAGADILDGGNGTDWTSYIESKAGVNVNLETHRGMGGDAEGDVLSNLENVKGSIYSDRLTGDSANNYLDSSGGDDTIDGSLGSDTIDGGAGVDNLRYSRLAQAVTVNLKDGTTNKGDTIILASANLSSIENLEGTLFDDTLGGDIGNNLLVGLAGNDSISGDDGSDRIIGGQGADTIDGGAGIDWAEYSGSSAGVTVNLLTGIGTRNDAEGDRLTTIENLRGSRHSDILIGDAGANDIAPGLSALPGDALPYDGVDGGAGQDRLFIDYSSEDTGTGLDGGYFLGSTDAGLFLRLTSDNLNVLDAAAFTSIERLNVIGTIKDDTIYGGGGDDVLLPGSGNDTVYGGRGSNDIQAGDGNDVVIDQNDINRSLGNDLGQPDNSYIVLDGGRGIDTLSINLSGKTFDANFAIRNFSLISIDPLQENLNQRISLSDGSTISGFEIFKDITTGYGDDILIQLGRVNNTFITGDGNDVMNPGLGIDVVDSTPSNLDSDLLIVDYSVEDIGTGITTAFDRSGTGRLYRRTIDDRDLLDEVRFSNIERFNVYGTSQTDQIAGGIGSDALSGNAGDDFLTGNRGNDFLAGGDGSDRLVGVDESNNLILANFPGAGEVDTLTGGAGADTFGLGDRSKPFYLGGGGTDAAIITDFNPAEGDILELNGFPSDYALVFEDTDKIAVDIYYKNALGGTDLIAVLNGLTDFDLNGNYIHYLNNNPNLVGLLNDSIQANAIVPIVVPPDLQLQEVADLNPQPLPPAAEDLNPQPLPPIETFAVQQNNDTAQLFTALTALGNTTGLSNFEIESTGDGRAFGTFQNDPFGLGSGIVLSTGKVEDLVGQNTSDGGLSPGTNVSLKFTKLPGVAGPAGSLGTAIFVADLAKVGFDIKSLNFADSGSLIGGAPGRFSGFDLDAIKFSHTLINDASQIATLPNLSELDVFDFTPVGTRFTPGTQHSPVDPTRQELFGTVNGLIYDGLATLSTFDAFNYFADDRAFGAVSLGDGGKVGFNLTQAVSTTNAPLYLYVGEAANNGETPDGAITASNREINTLSDLSTDFGTPGATDDDISLKFSFDADATAQNLYFQFVFGSEELVEYGGSDFNDAFSLELNGFNMAQLSDGAAVTINNLAPRPFAPYNSDLVYNPVATGPVSSQTKLDGYTKVLTFAAPLDPNTKNTLEIKVKDGRDGLLDSAVFIKAGTFGTIPPVLGTSLQVQNDSISTDEDTAITIDPATLLLNDVAANSGDILSVISVDGTATAGTVNFDGSLITYDPARKFEALAAGETATDQFGYSVSDGKGGTSLGSVVVAIAGVNDAPIAIDDTVTATGNLPITITAPTLLSNDSDVDASDILSITNVDDAINGTVNIDSNGDIVFTPDSIFSGQGSFKYTTDDGKGGTATALVNITTPSDNGFKDIDGTPGDDILVGTAANDCITGFQGADILTGGGGKNLFIYNTVYDGVDTITDFKVGIDRIELVSLLASRNYQGTDPIADGYIQFSAQGSDTMISIDPDGSGSLRQPRPLALVQNVTVSSLNSLSNFVF